jgi:membrane protease YdiL (CAAX protease family)
MKNDMKNTFLVLWIAGIIGTLAILPYLFTLQSDVLYTQPLHPIILLLLSLVQGSFFVAIAVYIGLRAAQGVGLTMPFSKPLKKKTLKVSVLWGFGVGILLYIADVLFISQTDLNALGGDFLIPFWQRLLTPLYGGITEEIFLRLFFVSVLAWIVSKVLSVKQPTRNSGLMWGVIITSAIIFGLLHLPTMAAIVPLTTFIVIRTLLLNAIGGLVFGWLYWKKGLESAMIAHAASDVMIHIILPMMV